MASAKNREAVRFSPLLDALAINLPTMTDLHNANDKLTIRYGIDDSICPLADSILIVMAGEFFATGRSRVRR
ncbi:MAG: hypothetical protein WBX50_10540 [Candidatus Deferrimicrobiaceae bacterium]